MIDGDLTLETAIAGGLRRHGWLADEFGPDDDGNLAAEIASILKRHDARIVRIERRVSACVGCGADAFALRNLCSGCYVRLTDDEQREYFGLKLTDADVARLVRERGVTTP